MASSVSTTSRSNDEGENRSAESVLPITDKQVFDSMVHDKEYELLGLQLYRANRNAHITENVDTPNTPCDRAIARVALRVEESKDTSNASIPLVFTEEIKKEPLALVAESYIGIEVVDGLEEIGVKTVRDLHELCPEDFFQISGFGTTLYDKVSKFLIEECHLSAYTADEGYARYKLARRFNLPYLDTWKPDLPNGIRSVLDMNFNVFGPPREANNNFPNSSSPYLIRDFLQVTREDLENNPYFLTTMQKNAPSTYEKLRQGLDQLGITIPAFGGLIPKIPISTQGFIKS